MPSTSLRCTKASRLGDLLCSGAFDFPAYLNCHKIITFSTFLPWHRTPQAVPTSRIVIKIIALY